MGSPSGLAFVPPPPPPMSASPPRILIIGAGSRGQTYARSAVTSSNGVVAAVAEPDRFRRELLGREAIWGDSGSPPEGAEFESWRDFIAYEERRRGRVDRGDAIAAADAEGIDAAFVCVQDGMHHEVVVALARLGGIHIMCEKPLATRLDDCIDMYRALRGAEGSPLFSIGHVLRYSPHNIELRRLLLEDRVIGDVLSVVHTEPVGWWHFTHSYVRGNWRREDTSAPSLLTKSCHDIDLLLWLLCSPPSLAGGGEREAEHPDIIEARDAHLPSTVSSSGALQLFRRSRKPPAAGAATNCLSCPVEPTCKFSAKRIYVDGGGLRSLASSNKSWPVNVVVPDIEGYQVEDEARSALIAKLGENYGPGTPDSEVRSRNWFGRCVFESDNDVNDEQVVTIAWDDGHANARSSSPSLPRLAKTATLHMIAQTTKVCQRFTHVYGVDGELYADSQSITVEDFLTGSTTVHRPRMESIGHGGGDNGLTRQFVLAVDKVKNHGWSSARAQREIIGCTLSEVLRSHAMVFCAVDAQINKKVVDWTSWWDEQVLGKLDSCLMK